MLDFKHRYSRAGGNPVDKIPYKELIYRLDSRLRGNDERDGYGEQGASFLVKAR